MMPWVLAYVVAQRLLELAVARRNTRRLLAEGAREVGAAHYPLFIVLHASWLVAIAVTVPATRAANVPLLAVFVALQAMRVWVIASLGRYWTTRIITRDNAPLVRRGPYRWVRHPNYLIVAGEIAVLPLAFGAWGVAVIWSVMNGALLLHRIRIEEEALSQRRERT